MLEKSSRFNNLDQQQQGLNLDSGNLLAFLLSFLSIRGWNCIDG